MDQTKECFLVPLEIQEASRPRDPEAKRRRSGDSQVRQLMPKNLTRIISIWDWDEEHRAIMEQRRGEKRFWERLERFHDRLAKLDLVRMTQPNYCRKSWRNRQKLFQKRKSPSHYFVCENGQWMELKSDS